jgi:hypothetical protein
MFTAPECLIKICFPERRTTPSFAFSDGNHSTNLFWRSFFVLQGSRASVSADLPSPGNRRVMLYSVFSVVVLFGFGACAQAALRGAPTVLTSSPVVEGYVDLEEHVHLAEEVVLGDKRFTSREEFIFNGSRCRNSDYTDIQRYENQELLRTLPPEPPSDELRARPLRVYMHIIMSSSGQGNVENSVINSQMAVLNHAYKNIKFSFALAGVTRVKNSAWFTGGINSHANAAMKRALRKGSYSDLNVYTTAQTDSTLGWATMPTKVGKDIDFDGVVIDYRSMPGGSFFPYDQGHTLTHEAGHWLGLSHTFQGGCAVNPAGGDEVADTPAVKQANFGCPSDHTNSCHGNTGALKGSDPVHNFMDYVDDGCMHTFTKAQGHRARSMYRLYRLD